MKYVEGVFPLQCTGIHSLGLVMKMCHPESKCLIKEVYDGEQLPEGVIVTSPLTLSLQGSLFLRVFFFTFYLVLALLGLCGLWAFFSSWGELGLLCRCRVQASYCGRFLCFETQALGHAGFSSCGCWAPLHRLNSCGAWT